MASFVTQIHGDTLMIMEAENTGTFAKSDSEIKANPMAAFDNAVQSATTLSRVLSARLSSSLRDAPVESAEVGFGVRVNEMGAVMIARDSEHAQFKIRLVLRVNGHG